MLRECVAKNGGVDSFAVKVHRRKHQGLPLDRIALLTGATVEHFVNPELWVPQLCGGGKLMLSGYHASDSSKQIGGFVQFEVNTIPEHEVDFEVVKRADWRGPSSLEFPIQPAQRPSDDAGMYRISPPPASGDGGSATMVGNPHQAWPRQAGGGLGLRIQRPDYGEEGVTDRALRDRGVVENERRNVEKERLENERERHAAQLESLKKSHEADMRAMEMRILTTVGNQNKSSGPDPMVEFLKANAEQAAEDRRAAAAERAEDRRAAEAARAAERAEAAENRRAAEALRSAERAEAAQQRAADNARFERLMDKMTERKPEKDPLETIKLVSDIIGKKDDGGGMKMMHSVMETMGTLNGLTMDFVDRMADMQLGAQEKESPVVKGIEAATKAIGAMVRGSAAQKQAAQVQQPQLPAQQAAQPQRQPQQSPQALTVLEQIEKAIRLKIEPREVARVLISQFNDATIQAAVVEAGGDFEAAFDRRLGNWKNENPDNMTYFKTLLAEVEKAAIKAGLIPGDEAPAPAPQAQQAEPEDAQIEEPENDADEGDGDDQGDE